MGLLWLLVITCLSCVFKDLHAESTAKENVEFSEDSAFIMSSLFGFRPCLDEDCSDLPDKTSAFVNEDIALQDSPGSEYTPKHSKVTSPGTEVEYCLPLHASTLRDVSIIEKRHPDIQDVKLKVIEGVVAYIAQLSVVHVEDCDATIKLLDFIILAAQLLRHEYIGHYGKTCNYTECTDGKSAEHPDHSEVTATTPKCDHEPSVTPDYVSTEADYKPSTEADYKPSYPEEGEQHNTTVSQVEATVTPCPELSDETDEIIAEDYVHPSPHFVGSVRGIPGVNYPNYTDVPVTSFSCADKKYIPGFYADLETGCQVFHVCYEHRRESFLCPVGTVFNQPILACDYWYSSNCSLATAYYEVNAKAEEETQEEEMNVAVGELITVLVEGKYEKDTEDAHHEPSRPQPEVDITMFLPVKAKVTEFTRPAPEVPGAAPTVTPQALEVDEVASQIFHKMVSSATNVVSNSRGVIGKIPDSGLLYGVKGKLATVAGGIAIKPVMAKLAAAAVSVPAAKVVAAKAAVPIAATAKLAAVAASIPFAKVAAAKAAVPIVAKAKLAAAAASVPIAKVSAAKAAVPIVGKAKLAAVPVFAKAKSAAAAKAVVPIAVKTKLAAVPKVALKASVPVLKSKMVASGIPSIKSKMVASVLKGKKLKAASTPLVKAKMMTLPLVKSAIAGPVPLVKAKLATAAAISPLTKKALALGYMKLLKAKKLALMG